MPFIRTATLGGSGAGVLPQGDVVNHFNQVRLRAVGSGTLLGVLYSLDDISSQNLTNFTLSSSRESIQRSLCNFTQQRASLKLYTNVIDEIFQITRIVIYTRPVATEYPG